MKNETVTISSEPDIVVPACDTVSTPVENAYDRDTETQSKWWRFADLGVLGVWIAVVGFTLQYHEKWADEAQAWLIARDLDLKTIWFHELRYEGSPGLWHTILWVAQHVFHLKYGALGYIGMAGAVAGAAVLIFKAPFPRYIRWPLAFTYFMVYQYAVIARPYTLLPLLAFLAAILFKDIQHPERMTVVLVLLANLSLHGTILAGCFGLGYVIEAYKARGTLDARIRRRYWICITVMAATFLFIVAILKPTPDVEEFAPKSAALMKIQPTRKIKLIAGISGGFLDYFYPSVAFVLLAGVWCYTRKRLLMYALPVILLFALYAAVHGYAHHHGTMFIGAIIGLWIAWPSDEEVKRFNWHEQWAMRGMTFLMLCLCSVNVWDSAVVIRREYLFPYSGAEDAARYLKSVGAGREPVFGYVFGINAVQAYFDHNFFANLPTSYYHLGLPKKGDRLDEDELRRVNPEYLVTYTVDPELMLDTDGPMWESLGYELVHFSDGYYLYKRLVYEREAYLIFHRVHRASSSKPFEFEPIQ
jgi:hypothetical protein